jgi:hypothetical protein
MKINKININEDIIFSVLWEFLSDSPEGKIDRYIEEMKKRVPRNQ